MLIEELIKDAYRDTFSEVEKTASVEVDFENARKVTRALSKVASLPYKPEAYQAVCGIMKIASELFEEAISALQAEMKKTAEFEKRSKVRSLIDEMISRGLLSKGDVQEKISELMKKSDRELEIVKEAIDLASSKSDLSAIFDLNSEKTAPTEMLAKREMFEGCI